MRTTTKRIHQPARPAALPLALAFALVLAPAVAPPPAVAALDVAAVSKSVVRVRAYENNRAAAEGAGFVVNEDGQVLTYAHLVKGADGVSVVSLATGAELLAQQSLVDPTANLAVLTVTGLNLPPLPLSEQGGEVGRIVRTLQLDAAGKAAASQGTVGSHHEHPPAAAGLAGLRMLRHNAMLTASEFGMPLLNECDQVAAVNLPDPAAARRLFRRVKDPQGAVFALRAGDVIAWLERREVAHTVVDDPCLSAVELAELGAKEKEELAQKAEEERQAAEAAREKAEAEKQAAEAARQAAEAEKQAAEEARKKAEAEKQAAEAARQQAEDEKQAAETGKQEAETTLKQEQEEKEAAEAARQEAEEKAGQKEAEAEAARQEARQRLLWGAVSGGVLVALALLGWFLTARRRRQAEAGKQQAEEQAEQEKEAREKAEAATPRPAPFSCLLEGQDDGGRTFALNIPALDLGATDGVVIGRNPANAAFIIDHDAVSREHARLVCAGEALQVEDLGATNGTRVNGRPLGYRESASLRDRDQLQLGPVTLTVRLQ